MKTSSKINDLFNNVELDVKTLSCLLRHMRSLMGPNIISDTILRCIWMDKLPTTTTQVLASVAEDEDLKKTR